MSPSGRRVHAGALTAAVLLAALASWAGLEAFGYGLWRGRSPGEGLYPFVAALTLLALSLAFGLEALSDPADPPGEEDGEPAPAKVALYLVGLLGFGVLLEPAGWMPVTALVLLLILKGAERLSWPAALGVIAVTLAATHLVFERLLGLALPRGAFL